MRSYSYTWGIIEKVEGSWLKILLPSECWSKHDCTCVLNGFFISQLENFPQTRQNSTLYFSFINCHNIADVVYSKLANCRAIESRSEATVDRTAGIARQWNNKSIWISRHRYSTNPPTDRTRLARRQLRSSTGLGSKPVRLYRARAGSFNAIRFVNCSACLA